MAPRAKFGSKLWAERQFEAICPPPPRTVIVEVKKTRKIANPRSQRPIRSTRVRETWIGPPPVEIDWGNET